MAQIGEDEVRFGDLSLPEDLDRILDLGPPEEVLGPEPEDRGYVMTGAMRRLWCEVTDPDRLSGYLDTPADDDLGDGRFWLLFAKLGTYYGYLAKRAAAADPLAFFKWIAGDNYVNPAHPDAVKNDTLEIIEKQSQAPAMGEDQNRLREVYAKAVFWKTHHNAAVHIRNFDHLLLSLMISHVFGLIRDPARLSGLELNPEAGLLQSLKQFLGELEEDETPLKQMGQYQLQQLLDYGVFIYSRVRNKEAEKPTDSAFSDRWLEELVQLSRRDPKLAERDGLKHLEKRFERYVSLLLQTLGLQTVPALAGEEAPDVLCLAREGQTKFTILVDAKSGKAPYSLPKDDQRAITDYVRQTVGSLADLPDLSCVLIVGHGPAGTVEAKLESLEGRVGVPLRFIDAGDLADLRKQISGPLRADLLLKMLVQRGPILTSEHVEKLRDRHSEIEQNFVEFVRGMRRSMGSL